MSAVLLSVLHFIGILLLVLLVFNFIILVHEWGHFLAARWRGLKIDKFQIWMGKPLWRKTYNGVQYGLGWLPIGGFVQLPQMSPMEAIEGKTGEPREQLPPVSPLDKIIVAFAGPLFSMLLALAFACVVWLVGRPVQKSEQSTVIGSVSYDMPAGKSGKLKPGDTILEVDGQKVTRFLGPNDSVMWRIASARQDDIVFKIQRPGEASPREVTLHAALEENPEFIKWRDDTSWWQKLFGRPPYRRVGIGPESEGIIEALYANSPAEEAGLCPGDVLLEANGEKLYHPRHLASIIYRDPDRPVSLKVKRGGEIVQTVLTPRKPDEPKDNKELKAHDGIKEMKLPESAKMLAHPNPFQLIGDFVENTFSTLSALVSPSSTIGASHMSGPVGIMSLYYRIFQEENGWRLVLFFSVIINVGLAIFNLLPIPILDGGHIVMSLMEMVRGRTPNVKVLEFVQLVCVLALLSFVLFVTMKDVGGLSESDGEIKFYKRDAAARPA